MEKPHFHTIFLVPYFPYFIPLLAFVYGVLVAENQVLMEDEKVEGQKGGTGSRKRVLEYQRPGATGTAPGMGPAGLPTDSLLPGSCLGWELALMDPRGN